MMIDNSIQYESSNDYKDIITKVSTTKFEQDVRAVMQELGDLLIQKHYDYGPKNIG